MVIHMEQSNMKGQNLGEICLRHSVRYEGSSLKRNQNYMTYAARNRPDNRIWSRLNDRESDIIQYKRFHSFQSIYPGVGLCGEILILGQDN